MMLYFLIGVGGALAALIAVSAWALIVGSSQIQAEQDSEEEQQW